VISRRSSQGFSLVELIVASAVIVTLCGIALISLTQTLKNARVANAFDTTMSQFKRARQAAISERCVYRVQIVAPRTITLSQIRAGVTTPKGSIDLPTDIQFRAEPGIPVTRANTPDNLGVGGTAIDFSVDYGGAGTDIYFQPDGSAKDDIGRLNNGVAYFVRPGELSSARAVSVLGATGRVKGWRIVVSGGTSTWK
jgi:prepilin-type N-terminal cleavage/methylation domain-containing protein